MQEHLHRGENLRGEYSINAFLPEIECFVVSSTGAATWESILHLEHSMRLAKTIGTRFRSYCYSYWTTINNLRIGRTKYHDTVRDDDEPLQPLSI